MGLLLALTLATVPLDPPLPPDAAWRAGAEHVDTWRAPGTLDSLQAYYRELLADDLRGTRKSCPAAWVSLRTKDGARVLKVESRLVTTRWRRVEAREVEGGVELTVTWVPRALPRPPEPHAPVALPEPVRSQRPWRADLRP